MNALKKVYIAICVAMAAALIIFTFAVFHELDVEMRNQKQLLDDYRQELANVQMYTQQVEEMSRSWEQTQSDGMNN